MATLARIRQPPSDDCGSMNVMRTTSHGSAAEREMFGEDDTPTPIELASDGAGRVEVEGGGSGGTMPEGSTADSQRKTPIDDSQRAASVSGTRRPQKRVLGVTIDAATELDDDVYVDSTIGGSAAGISAQNPDFAAEMDTSSDVGKEDEGDDE